jgi:hypothetical protein
MHEAGKENKASVKDAAGAGGERAESSLLRMPKLEAASVPG